MSLLPRAPAGCEDRTGHPQVVEQYRERPGLLDGDLAAIPAIPAQLEARYRTAFQIAADALIDAATRRQKWIDQSQSLNLFLPGRT